MHLLLGIQKLNEELIGTYVGNTTKIGQFGDYKVHMIKTHGSRILYVSGTMIDNLFALVHIDCKVKLIFKGKKKAQDSEREYKVFELFTEEEIVLSSVSSA